MGESSKVRRVVRSAACAACGQSLRGVPIVDGAAACPECGTLFVPALARLGPIRRERAGRRSSGAAMFLVGLMIGAMVLVVMLLG